MQIIWAATVDIPDPWYGQVYNVGTGKNYSVNELAAMISDNTVNVETRLGETKLSLANNSKLKCTFGWEPTMNLEDWVADNV